MNNPEIRRGPKTNITLKGLTGGLILLVSQACSGGGAPATEQASPFSSPTPEVTPIATMAPTASPVPSASPEASPSMVIVMPTPEVTPLLVPTPKITPSPTPSVTASATAEASPTPQTNFDRKEYTINNLLKESHDPLDLAGVEQVLNDNSAVLWRYCHDENHFPGSDTPEQTVQSFIDQLKNDMNTVYSDTGTPYPFIVLDVNGYVKNAKEVVQYKDEADTFMAISEAFKQYTIGQLPKGFTWKDLDHAIKVNAPIKGL